MAATPAVSMRCSTRRDNVTIDGRLALGLADNAAVSESGKAAGIPGIVRADADRGGRRLYIKTSSAGAAIDADGQSAVELTRDVVAPLWRTPATPRGRAYCPTQVCAHLLPTGDAHWALDARTGRPAEGFGISGAIDRSASARRAARLYHPDVALIVVGDVVIVGPVISDGPRH